MADAFTQIAAAMLHQVAPIEAIDCGTPPPETPYVGRGESLAVTDTGIADHAREQTRAEDRDDAGQLLDPAVVSTEADWCD